MKILIVEKDKAPIVKEIKDELEAMQEVVGGNIEMLMPFDDEVAIICHEEGKYICQPNRALYDKNDNDVIIDIIYGTFFIVGAPADSDKLEGLSNELIQKYFEYYKNPDAFIITNDGELIVVRGNKL